MKKYRQTRITVRTREAISWSSCPGQVAESTFCPLCRSPLPALSAAIEVTPAPADSDPRPIEMAQVIEADAAGETEPDD